MEGRIITLDDMAHTRADDGAFLSDFGINDGELIAGATATALLANAVSNPSRRTFFELLALAGAGTALGGCAALRLKPDSSQRIDYYLPDYLTSEQIKYIKEESESVLEKIVSSTRRPLSGRITITTIPGTESYAYTDRLLIEIGENRLPGKRQKTNEVPFGHEIGHLVLGEEDTFLSEGTTVVLQGLHGTNYAYPNFKDNLQRLASSMNIPSLKSLQNVSYHRISNLDERRAAYVSTGAFVEYLIRDVLKIKEPQKDIREFMKFFYSDRDYKRFFGKSLEELELDWRQKLASIRLKYSTALQIEITDPSWKPLGPLTEYYKALKARIEIEPTRGGGYNVPLFTNLLLKVKDINIVIEQLLWNDLLPDGRRIPGNRGSNYRVGPLSRKRFPEVFNMYLDVIGNGGRLEENETRRIPNFPIPFSPTWPGEIFSTYVGFKVEEQPGRTYVASTVTRIPSRPP